VVLLLHQTARLRKSGASILTNVFPSKEAIPAPQGLETERHEKTTCFPAVDHEGCMHDQSALPENLLPLRAVRIHKEILLVSLAAELIVSDQFPSGDHTAANKR
jgi:hypothetical protein